MRAWGGQSHHQHMSPLLFQRINDSQQQQHNLDCSPQPRPVHAVKSGSHIHHFCTSCLYQAGTHPKQTATTTHTHTQLRSTHAPSVLHTHARTHLAVNYTLCKSVCFSWLNGHRCCGHGLMITFSLRQFMEQEIGKVGGKEASLCIYNKLFMSNEFRCTHTHAHAHTHACTHTHLLLKEVNFTLLSQRSATIITNPHYSLSLTHRLTSLHAHTPPSSSLSLSPSLHLLHHYSFSSSSLFLSSRPFSQSFPISASPSLCLFFRSSLSKPTVHHIFCVTEETRMC